MKIYDRTLYKEFFSLHSKQQKEEEDSTVKTKSIDSKELEKRYQKRQESIQDIVKKKGNIS